MKDMNFSELARKRKALLAGILATGLLTFGTSAAHAGCKIEIDVKNSTGHQISVDWKSSKVKIKNGVFKKLGTNSQTIANGATKSHSYNADFGCGKQRQYKVYWSGGGEDGWEYYPSTTGFTTKQSFKVTAN